jgi:hypothetical protein
MGFVGFIFEEGTGVPGAKLPHFEPTTQITKALNLNQRPNYEQSLTLRVKGTINRSQFRWLPRDETGPTILIEL